MEELIIKFIVGGAIVSAFAALGDVFKPKSFAGLFGAAPSVALATIILAIQNEGPQYVSTEARSMMVGAVALICYSQVVCWLLMRKRWSSWIAATSSWLVWGVVCFALWHATPLKEAAQ